MTTTQHSTDAGRGRTPVWDIAWFEGRARLRITGVIAALFTVYAGLYLWLGPAFIADGEIQVLLDALPPVVIQLFGFQSLTSLEGLFASEFYTFGWIVGLGGYVAYSAAGSVAGDIDTGRIDNLLAGPVSRRSVLLGKYLALLVPILVLNVVIPVVLYAGSVLVAEPMTVSRLLALHALSVPYLLTWAAIGLVLGVTVRRDRTAGRIAIGLVFFAWIYESVIVTTAYDWLALVAPSHYFDPPAILVGGTYDVAGAGLLCIVAVVLVVSAIRWFRRVDV